MGPRVARKILELFGAQPARWRRAATAAVYLAYVAAFAARVLAGFPPRSAVAIVDVAFAGLAGGWTIRCATHCVVRYYFPPSGAPGRRLRLVLASLLNVCFSVAWVAYATNHLGQAPDPVASCAAMALASALIFVLSLWTLAEARAIDRPRASDWIYEHLRGKLEAGEDTWPGWLLVVVLEKRTPPERLSAYVKGTLAALLVGIALTSPAVIRLAGRAPGRSHPRGAAVLGHAKRGEPRTLGAATPGGQTGLTPLPACPSQGTLVSQIESILSGRQG